MKKKFKLLATVASLSLTMALMVFGVIAATSVNVTISSNVSYSAEGVAFKLYGTSELLDSQPSGAITDLTDETADSTLEVGVTHAATGNMTLPDQVFTADERWVVYTFTVENIGSNTIDTINISVNSGHANVIASTDSTSLTPSLTNGQAESFRCYFYLDDINQSITSSENTITIAVGTTEPTNESSIAPSSLNGFTSQTAGNTTTYTRGDEQFVVTEETSGTTVTETNTFTFGGRTTSFTTSYDSTTVQASASQVEARTFGAQTLSSSYKTADRTLVSFNSMTGGTSTDIAIPAWLNIVTLGNGSASILSSALQTTVTAFEIPETVTSVSSGAFSNCTALTDVTINSQTVASALTSLKACGDLMLTSVQLNFGAGTTPSTFVTSNYTLTGGKYVAEAPSFSLALSSSYQEGGASEDGSDTWDGWLRFSFAEGVKFFEVNGSIVEVEGTSYEITLYGTKYYEETFEARVMHIGGYSGEYESVYVSWSCLTGDTLITMADGKKKRLDQIKKGDKILAVDPKTGKLVVSEVTETDTNEEKYGDSYKIYTLSDGTELKIVKKHRFYNCTKKKTIHIGTFDIGDELMREDGTRVKLVSVREVVEKVRHYTIFTEHQTYFANGMLSGNKYTQDMDCDKFDFKA